jgi:hypothetical protein
MAMLKRCGIIVAAVSAVYASGVVASSPSLSYSVSWNSSPFPSGSVRLLSSDRLMTETWASGQGLLRSTRAVYTFAVNTIDYKVSLMRYDPNSEEYYNTRDEVSKKSFLSVPIVVYLALGCCTQVINCHTVSPLVDDGNHSVVQIWRIA